MRWKRLQRIEKNRPFNGSFVDEVHRFSKSQQDAFLPHVESGLFTFIGATTENPSFEVISALLSRSTVYVLESLKEEDLKELLHRALEREYLGLKVNEEAEKILIGLADGDARRFLNALEVSATMAKIEALKSLMRSSFEQHYLQRFADLIRAVITFMTKFPLCINPFEDQIPMRLCIGCAECSTAAWIPCTLHGA